MFALAFCFYAPLVGWRVAASLPLGDQVFYLLSADGLAHGNLDATINPGRFFELLGIEPQATDSVTHVVDRGLPIATLESLLDLAGAHIDFVKFGWGTAYVSRHIRAKVVACREAKVQTCIGGTLLELACVQGKMREFVRWADSIGFDGVEVSEGTVELGAGIKAGLIEAMARDFVVLAEVGSKDVEAPVRPSAWAAQMEADLAAGAAFVIAEGRESGTVGLYHPDGRVLRADTAGLALRRHGSRREGAGPAGTC